VDAELIPRLCKCPLSTDNQVGTAGEPAVLLHTGRGDGVCHGRVHRQRPGQDSGGPGRSPPLCGIAVRLVPTVALVSTWQGGRRILVHRYTRLLVRVWDDDHIVNNALQENDIDLPGDVERDICFFLGQLIEKFWKKFKLRDIDIQFLLAKKVSFDISMSEEHLRECHESKRSILEKFHSFILEVRDVYCYLQLEGQDVLGYITNKLVYLERDMNASEIGILCIPQRADYMSYFLDLNLTEVFLTKQNPLRS